VSRAEAIGDAFPQEPGAHPGIGAETEEGGRVEVEMQVDASEEQIEERARGKWPQERGNAEHRTEAGAPVGELNSLERREKFLLISQSPCGTGRPGVHDAARDVVGPPVVFKGLGVERSDDQAVIDDLDRVFAKASVVE